MKAKTKGRVELRGHIYERGEIAEVSDDELAERPGCFEAVKADETDETASKEQDADAEKARPNGLTRAALAAKLDALGIHYKARDTVEQLEKRLAEVIDHGATGKE